MIAASEELGQIIARIDIKMVHLTDCLTKGTNRLGQLSDSDRSLLDEIRERTLARINDRLHGKQPLSHAIHEDSELRQVVRSGIGHSPIVSDREIAQ